MTAAMATMRCSRATDSRVPAPARAQHHGLRSGASVTRMPAGVVAVQRRETGGREIAIDGRGNGRVELAEIERPCVRGDTSRT